MTKCLKYAGLCLIYTIALLVFCWVIFAILAIKIPIGSYFFTIPIRGNSLESFHELVIAPKLQPTIAVHDRVTLRNLRPVMDNIFRETRLHSKLRGQQIHAVSFRAPDYVAINGEIRLYQNRYLNKKKSFVANTKFSISKKHVLWIPVEINIKHFPSWLDPKKSPFVLNIRKQTGLSSLVIHQIRLENSDTNKHTVNMLFEIGIFDIWNKIF